MNSTSFAGNQVIQSYLLREQRKVFLPAASTGVVAGAHAHKHLALAIVADLAQAGLTLDGAAVARLNALDEAALTSVYHSLGHVAKEAVGAHAKYRPLFRDFPRNVPDDFDHFIRRIFGYVETMFGVRSSEHTVLSCGHVVNHRLFDLSKFGGCPVCQRQVPELSGQETAPAELLDEATAFKVLGLAEDADVWTSFSRLAAARTSLSESQKGFLSAVVSMSALEAARRLPQDMPFKENASFVLGALLKAGCVDPAVFAHVKTPTDVLRVAVALCGGDVSLKENTRFKLGNAHRRFLLQAFERLPQTKEHLLEEMAGYRGRWVRLGEVLHVRQFERHCPKAVACFSALRNNERVATYDARVEHLLNTRLTGVAGVATYSAVGAELLALLSQRPGEFARKLDVLLQRGLSAQQVVGAFEAVASKVSTGVLLTLLAHLRHRNERAEFRAFMPKGTAAKMYVLDGDKRPPLAMASSMSLQSTVRTELLRRFAELPKLGRVFVSDKLADVLVPTALRSASTGFAPMTRGSRLPFDASKDFLRLFLNWKETPETGRIDVDLSCGLFNEDWKRISHLSWTSMHAAGRSVHSGDVRSGDGPDGAAEFIDLDLKALRKSGVRYASVSVISYTGQTFDKFPCFAGFMERAEPSKGKYFEAKTVVNKFDVTGERAVMVPMFVDLHTEQMVWADMGMKGRMHSAIEGLDERFVQQHKAILALRNARVSLKELFELHGKARGELVGSAEQADLVLDERKVLELDDIMANWL